MHFSYSKYSVYKLCRNTPFQERLCIICHMSNRLWIPFFFQCRQLVIQKLLLLSTILNSIRQCTFIHILYQRPGAYLYNTIRQCTSILLFQTVYTYLSTVLNRCILLLICCTIYQQAVYIFHIKHLFNEIPATLE